MVDAHLPTGRITEVLQRWGEGDSSALDELMPVVYPELRRQAVGRLRKERSNHTLQPTALIHEAFLRLAGVESRPGDRVHFFSLASVVMRQVLIDYARAQKRAKRGGEWHRCTFEEAIAKSVDTPALVLDLDDALTRLASQQDRAARVLELHYFGGMNYEEIGLALAISERTVSRELRFGKAWLRSELGAAG